MTGEVVCQSHTDDDSDTDDFYTDFDCDDDDEDYNNCGDDDYLGCRLSLAVSIWETRV